MKIASRQKQRALVDSSFVKEPLLSATYFNCNSLTESTKVSVRLDFSQPSRCNTLFSMDIMKRQESFQDYPEIIPEINIRFL